MKICGKKMNRIKELPDTVKQKIAAGEVVEGPFSIVKELMENALDAGATEVGLQLLDSGLKKIQITDNGYGIYKEDIPLTIKEHATSKIEDIYDIETISSYGFRGEALSSMSSISKFTLISRSIDEEIGGKLIVDGDVEFLDFAGPTGTTIIVENLFYNIPARKKFLKAKRTELRYAREIFLKVASVNFDVAFTLDVDGKRHITLPVAETLRERMVQIYGAETVDNLYFEELSDLKVSIGGFLSRPGYMKSSRTMQLLYINGRPVEYKYLGFLLSKAYEAVALRGKHPVAILFIDIDPELIDVNVHPAKREIKLFDQKYVDSLILSLAKKALNKSHSISDDFQKDLLPTKSEGAFVERSKIEDESVQQNLNYGSSSKKENYSSGTGRQPLFRSYSGSETSVNSNSGYNEKTDFVTTHPVNDSSLEYETNYDVSIDEEVKQNIEEVDGVKIVGTVFDTFLIIEKDGIMEVIDFHAAHERILYDELRAKDISFEKQELIFPKVMQFSVQDYNIVLEHIEFFSELGFDLDDFSDNSVAIRAVPEIAAKIDPEDVINDFITSVKQENEELFDIRQDITATIACHSARRAGDKLSLDEMKILVSRLYSEDHEKRCPHGRPFIFTLSKTDLEKMFKRM